MSVDLNGRAEAAGAVLGRCRLCGHACGANRAAGEIGRCGAGALAIVAAHLLHFGEEPPISGERGSGTLFFSGCPLTCVFCQNHQISQDGLGRAVSADELAGMMLDLQARGAQNINLVSPTPWAPQIIQALALARPQGLNLPLVYNTGGFDSLVALRLMDGLVDVYLPDAKYADDAAAARLSGAGSYPAVNRAALREMFRQVGPLAFDGEGAALRGVLVRHLVLPHNLAGSAEVLRMLAGEFGADVWVSLMAQYLPRHLAAGQPERFPDLSRPLTETEYDEALEAAESLGMENVFIQELSASDAYVPDFREDGVFARTGRDGQR